MRLSYQHLLYFWAVVRGGSLARASEELRLSAPTIRAQLKRLEERLGEKLLAKSGRRLVPTETGRMVFRYADEIFGLGREMVDTLKSRPTGRPMRLVVGIDDVLPKEIAHRLIEPALQLDRAIVVSEQRVPADVITMRSQVRVRDLASGVRSDYTLAYPWDADVASDRISVLAPLGTALLGYRENDELEWSMPGGLRRLRVEKILFQPEAALRAVGAASTSAGALDRGPRERRARSLSG